MLLQVDQLDGPPGGDRLEARQLDATCSALGREQLDLALRRTRGRLGLRAPPCDAACSHGTADPRRARPATGALLGSVVEAALRSASSLPPRRKKKRCTFNASWSRRAKRRSSAGGDPRPTPSTPSPWLCRNRKPG